jgi:hypothetical protein
MDRVMESDGVQGIVKRVKCGHAGCTLVSV